MKNYIKIIFGIIILISVLLSCKKRSDIIAEKIANKEYKVNTIKFEEGTHVCVGDNEFIVERYNSFKDTYILKLIDCRSNSCFYHVNSSEIKKCK